MTQSALIGQRVIVRATEAGVFFGTLEHVDGRMVRLSDCRRLWQWFSGGGEISLSGVARHGLLTHPDVRITGPVETHEILDACEILSMTPAAIQSLETYEVARAQ